jgi:ferredoxin
MPQPDETNSANSQAESPSELDGTIQTVRGQMPGKYLVKVDRSKCIGAGTCQAISPKVFKLDDQNTSTVISQAELDDVKLLAAQSCPVSAIIIENVETGERVWPK